MKDYKLTVGLEIHAELNTRTKMFCDSRNDSDEKRPNVNICPVCMGHPGTLPVINKEAVKSILRLGLAVGGTLADYTEFDRKNYFYPDIPKGYQVSQYKHPLVSGGELAGVQITRIHLEEDTARSMHDKGEGSLVDFNRAGVPLMELVTEPVIHEAATASFFAKELQLLLTTLGIAEANMEKGEMRVEANISVSKGSDLGTKVEVKNLNSFRSAERAIAFEYERQSTLLKRGERVLQETRGWDDAKGETYSQRAKEESHDYRYFPEPDLPKLFIAEIPEFTEAELAKSLPELPEAKRKRFLGLGITPEHADIYVTQPEWGTFFEEAVKTLNEPGLVVLASNYITSELKALVSPVEFVELIRMVSKGEISSKGMKSALKVLSEKGGTAQDIVAENNLMQNSNEEELEKIAKEVMREEKQGVPLQYLVGQAMKKSGGRANPILLQEIFSKLL
ncbi:Asp-tRNA(Asn)/Glu-tRNA(Gln) amidotransferase subunit GatB [Candidatus Parcubacteria bacterium]|nr:Asp-tRNA(Asn)/Glu-tRNA(Gln) amidotransferase subunit GatB [Candidatus Parcubacteria bacterium]